MRLRLEPLLLSTLALLACEEAPPELTARTRPDAATLDAVTTSDAGVPPDASARDDAHPDLVALPDGGVEVPSDEALAALVAERCAPCHVGGQRQGGLNLDGTLAAATIGVPSQQAALSLVEPG